MKKLMKQLADKENCQEALPDKLDGDRGNSTSRGAPGLFGLNIRHRVIDLSDFSVMEKNYLND